MFSIKSSFLKQRYKKAKIFKGIAIFSVIFCLAILVTFLVAIAKNAILPLTSLEAFLDSKTIEFIETKLENKHLKHYFSRRINVEIQGKDSVKGFWVPVGYEFKKFIMKNTLENPSLANDFKLFRTYLLEHQQVHTSLNINFFKNGNSVYSETAGIKSAIIGSIFVLFLFILITIPIGIAVGTYISEFLPNGKRKSLLQVNIQNLASVPSIIYGIITLNIFINTLSFTRSSALVGAIALSMLILPMMIMITYNATSMVPQAYKDSSLAMGLSNVQTALRITLPFAMPRIITGILLAIARAAGETAPLIMVGMAFFSSSSPSSLTSEAVTTLPLQIFLWTSNPQEAFIEHASAAILVFIMFLTTINLFVHFIRNKLNKV